MQRELGELRRVVAPRSLDDVARDVLQRDLAALQRESTEILFPEADEEAQEFATSLGDVFRAAGWQVELHPAVHPSTVIGVEIVVPGTWPKPEVPGVAEQIAEALNRAGVRASIGTLHELSPYRFFISVGKKPRGAAS